MTRDEAVEAAAKAICDESIDCEHSPDARFDECRLVARLAVDALRVPVLLNDLADRIEAMRINETDEFDAGYNAATLAAAQDVRAAAEGWGA